jgi:hypothetical protein
MKKIALLLSLMLAQTAFAADIKVSNAWMRATAPGQEVAGAFMDITSTVNAKLISASSPAAGKLELHTMSMDKGIMDMHEVTQIDLPKGKTISLAPGSLHVMLFDLKQAMKQGDSIPMTLDIVTANKKHQYINIKVSVRNLGGQ